MKRVFVSYSRNNLDVVTQFIQDLQAVGIDAWHGQTLTGGQRWWDNILLNIRECDIFISALSPESSDSEACKSELNYAVQLGKTILPVLVADGIDLNLLPAPLNEIQVTDYRGRDEGAAFALIKCIHTAPPNPPLPDPLPAPPRVPISYLSNLTERTIRRAFGPAGPDHTAVSVGRGTARGALAYRDSRFAAKAEAARRPAGQGGCQDRCRAA